MRKLSATLFIVCFALLGAFAQDGKTAMKEAKKALNSFKVNQDLESGNLEMAADKVSIALKSDEFKSDPRAWALKGEVYSMMSEQNTKAILTGGEMPFADAGLNSFKAYKKALDIADKKGDKNIALKGISDVAGHLSSTGNHFINTSQYAKAYGPLNAVYEADKVLVSNDMTSLFKSDEDKNSHLYAVAVCAFDAGKQDVAEDIYMKLYEGGSTEPRVYSMLFKMLIDKDESKAMAILAKGKELSPDSEDLLYAEINYLIQKQDYTTLEGKLKEAIAKNPDNPSIYLALGNVYSQLGAAAAAEGNSENHDNMMKEAMTYFEKALELKPESFDALYAIGSIYFNEGAVLTQKMSELGLSKEDQKKYEELDQEVKALFDQALPYFKRSEQINPSDRNTLIALKEIFARMNDFETSNEFKDRLERVENGETVSSSYFNK